MTTCQLCNRETDNSAFCSTCEPKASRVADVDSQAAAIAALVDWLTARLAAKGDIYQPDHEWQTLATVRSALVDAQRMLAELEGGQ
jgi:hypothetical protein